MELIHSTMIEAKLSKKHSFCRTSMHCAPSAMLELLQLELILQIISFSLQFKFSICKSLVYCILGDQQYSHIFSTSLTRDDLKMNSKKLIICFPSPSLITSWNLCQTIPSVKTSICKCAHGLCFNWYLMKHYLDLIFQN